MSTHIEIWDQDLDNLALYNRTYPERPNFLFPTKPVNQQTTMNMNTKTKRSEQITYNTTDLRNPDIENKLFRRTDPKDRDVLTLQEAQNLTDHQRLSTQQLYRRYHAPEINSLCYPNIDRGCWDNTTKAIYTTRGEGRSSPP